MTKTFRSQIISDTVRNMRRYNQADTRENRMDSIPATEQTAAYISTLSVGQWRALNNAISAEHAKQAAIDTVSARIAAKMAVRVSA